MSTTALTLAIVIAVVLVLACVGVLILLVRTLQRSAEDHRRRPSRPRSGAQAPPADDPPESPETP